MTVTVNPAIAGPENSAGGGGGGGGGVSLFTELTDASSANLPADNGPLATALNAKVPQTRQVAGHPLAADVTLVAADVGAVPTTRQISGHALAADLTLVKADVGLASVDNTADTAKPVSTAQQAAFNLKVDKLSNVDLGAGAVTILAATHANHHCFWHGTADTTFAFDPTGAAEGDAYEISHTGPSGVISLPTASPPGYKNQISPGEIGTFEFTGGSLQSAIPSSSGSVALAVTTGGTTTGTVRTCTPAAGWTGTFQWMRDGSAISAATSSTYTLVTADEGHVITCKFTPTFFTTNGITDTAPADTTPPTLVSATIPAGSPSQINLVFSEAMSASMGAGSKWAVSGAACVSIVQDTTTTAHLVTSAPLTVGTTYTLAYLQNGTADVQDISANHLANITSAAVTNNLVSSGSLSVAIIANAGYNLTTGAFLDWYNFGALGGNDVFKHSAGLIALLTETNGSRASGPGTFSNIDTWTVGDGQLRQDNTLTSSGNADEMAKWNPTSTSPMVIPFTAPANTATHKVRFRVANFNDTGLTASLLVRIALSDGSAAQYTNVPATTTGGNVTYTTYEATYNAASAGQTLNISLEAPSGNAGSQQAFVSLITYI